MLFNYGMETLTLMITKAIFSPLVRCSVLQRLSICDDDVILFVGPTTIDLTAVKGILDAFG
jgi:hypothetical protein